MKPTTRITDAAQAAGKTIHLMHEGYSDTWIIFTDGSWMAISAEPDWEGSYKNAVINTDEGYNDPSHGISKELVLLGFVSQQELDNEVAKQEQKQRENEVRDDLAQLKELLKRYPDAVK